MGLIRKFHGNLIVLAAAKRRRGVAYAPREKLLATRDRRVRQIVRFAARTVPYYRDWFLEQGANPRDFSTAEDLARLPLLEKSTVAADPERFRSESRRGRRAIRFTTSGSTGLPLFFYHDRRSILENIAYTEPERAVSTGLLGKKSGYRILRITRSASSLGEIMEFCARNTWIPTRPQRHSLDVKDPPARIIERIRELQPEILGGYGSYLEMLFRYIHEQKIDLPLPSLVAYGAEGMTSPGRKLITEVFGLPVVGAYNAIESFKIGFQCGHGPDYHLHEDLCHVRLVDSQGSDTSKGEAGEVVITNLVNRGTVLLNYRLGDIASLSRTACECGRTLRLMTGLEGRVLDTLHLSDGSFVHPGAVWSVLSTAEGLLRYQLIQHKRDRFELKLVTSDGDSYQRFIEQVLPELQTMVGETARIDVALYDELQPDSSGKFRPIISKCHGQTRGPSH